MTDSTPRRFAAQWLPRILLASVLLGIACGLLWWRWPADIPSAVERAGGRMVWGEQAGTLQRIAARVMGERAYGCVGIWLGDTAVDDEWLRRNRSGFSRLPGSVELALVRTRVTDDGLRHLRDIDNITNVSVASTSVTNAGLDHLAAIPNLDSLSVDRSRVTDAGLEALRRMPRLFLVALDGTQATEPGVAHLRSCPNVTWITLRDVDDEVVARCTDFTHLERLYLEGAGITDASVPVLSALPRLEAITLVDARITDAGFAALQQALPKCMLSRLTSAELKAMESQ